MISVETVMAAIPEETIPEVSTDGWSAARHWAARFASYPDGVSIPCPADHVEYLSESVRAWSTVESRIPVTEDVAFRIAGDPGIPDETKPCDDCHGNGSCSCRCGDEHDCAGCDGAGDIVTKHGREVEFGQAVYRTEGGDPTVIQNRYAELLRGYQVFRVPQPAFKNRMGCDCLIGVDLDGSIMVAVLPMLSPPRAPEAAK